jgi:fructosamine-3-kinase
MIEPVSQALLQVGDNSGMVSTEPVGGGCINNAMRLETAQDLYLLKWNRDGQPGMFGCEARGLELLAGTQTVRVPAVRFYQDTDGQRPGLILLEFLHGPRSGDPARLGEQLAELHRKGKSPTPVPAYGLDHENYLGSTRQLNGWETDWVRFFAGYRLHPQIELAQRNGRLPAQRRHQLERLIERLPGLLGGIQRQPSLIHGDLWSGNVIPGPDGLALIDPAVSYSDREAELAYTELFGGFNPRFYAAYQSTWPLDPDYSQRRDLYNLYHLLNHLNLFGESYGFQIDSILTRYL